MMSFLRSHCACKDVFQSSKEPATFNYQTSSATDGILALEVSLDVVSLEFMKSFWLVKQEPSSYSWSDFVAEGQTSWTGVRNYTARNNLRKMRIGDEVLFYHSGEEKAVVGIAKVMRTAYPDPTAKEGDWSTVDLAPIKSLRRPVALREIKGNPRLKGIPLVRLSRLSVMPLAESEFREIVKMSAR
jgi:predicted RNA-binding protein with PUA-like domain